MNSSPDTKTTAAARPRCLEAMKRKAASQPALEPTLRKLSSLRGKQAAGIPVDTDQEAYEVLHAIAPSQKVRMLLGMAASALASHSVAQALSPAVSSSAMVAVPHCVPCSLFV